jgi:hypothetical protein
MSAGDSSWARRIPADALLAVSGHLDLRPMVQFFLKQVPQHELAELTRNRRVAESLLGGNELLSAVLPALARDFCGHVLLRKDASTDAIKVEGAVAFNLSASEDAKLLPGITQGLEKSLSLLAAFFSAKGPDVVTVERERSNSQALQWLSAAAPIPAAFGQRGNILVAGSSKERVLASFELLEKSIDRSRLADHAQRFFPHANQLIWLDAAQFRKLLDNDGAAVARFFHHESSEEFRRFDHVQQLMRLVDSLFIAGRIESDHLRVTFGGGLDHH